MRIHPAKSRVRWDYMEAKTKRRAHKSTMTEADEIRQLTADLALLVLQARGYAVPQSFDSEAAIDRLMNFLFEVTEKP